MSYNFKETIEGLRRQENNSNKQGYDGDAIEYAFRRWCLQLLDSIILDSIKLRKRKSSKWNIFVGEYLKQGKSIKEASNDWKDNQQVKNRVMKEKQ